MKYISRTRHNINQYVVSLAVFLSFIFVFTACSTVPVTGRNQMTLVSEGQMVNLAEDQYREIIGKSTLEDNTDAGYQVLRAGQRIAQATDDFLRAHGENKLADTFQWEFHLIKDDKTINAWCMPGGKIAVYTGILPITQNETGLAVVMGHEVAHAVARHGNERLSQGLMVQMGAIGLGEALHTQPEATRELALEAFGVGSSVAYTLPYSRLQESEADHIGLILMASAGYDPREAIPFWERMAAAGGGEKLEILSTHPVHQTRIQGIQDHLAEALKYYQEP